MLGKYSSIMENTFIVFQNGKPMVPMVTTQISFANYVSSRSNPIIFFSTNYIVTQDIKRKTSGKKEIVNDRLDKCKYTQMIFTNAFLIVTITIDIRAQNISWQQICNLHSLK